jgi:hypothetical protein
VAELCQGRGLPPLTECWQLHEIVVWNPLKGVSSFAPGAQATGDNEDLKAKLLQLLRHPGARGFARSSTVEINLSILGKVLDFFDQVVRFDADRSRDALGVSVVIAVAPDIGN